MFHFKVEKELTCIAEGSGKFIAKKGAMIAYKGNFKFDKLIFGPDNGGGIGQTLFGFVKRTLGGEQIPLMTVEGSGSIYLAQDAYHIEIFELDPGESLSVEGENLLAFPQELHYDIRFVGVGVLSQRGLLTTVLTNKTNTVQQVAVITDGNPIFIEGPCVVDPDALVAWTGPDPSIKTDISWKTFIGQTSGESYQFEFHQPGQVVLVQPSERLSSLNISIDGNTL